jgi:uncharacterized membrane protein YfcA
VLPPFTIALLAAAAFGAGLVDAIGGGGGLISMPALLAAGLPPHLALGTNKGQAVFGATASALAFWRRGVVDRDRAPLGFAAGFAGSMLGARLVLAMPVGPLRGVMAILLLLAAALVLGRRRAPAAVATEPASADAAPARPRAGRGALLAIALGLGAYDGFFGPGTGSLLVIAFAAVFGDPLTRASGNAKIVNLASNVAAMLLFASHGTVLWKVALPMAAANAAGATAGAHLAIRNGDRLVRWVVLMAVLAAVVKLGVSLWGP